MRAFDRAKPPWYRTTWRRFKRATIDFLCVIGLIIGIIGFCLILLVFGFWVLLVIAIVSVATVLIALVNRT